MITPAVIMIVISNYGRAQPMSVSFQRRSDYLQRDGPDGGGMEMHAPGTGKIHSAFCRRGRRRDNLALAAGGCLLAAEAAGRLRSQ